MNSPAVEILKFMDMILLEEEQRAEKEKADWFMQYLITHFAQLPQGKEPADRRNEREKLLSSLQPKDRKKKEFKWGVPELDHEQLLLNQKGDDG